MITTTIVSPEKPKLEFNYPCLGESNHPLSQGMIVLFYQVGEGIVMKQGGNSSYRVGRSSHWNMSFFTPCPPGTKVEIVQQ